MTDKAQTQSFYRQIDAWMDAQHLQEAGDGRMQGWTPWTALHHAVIRPSMARQAGRYHSPRGVRGQANSQAADAQPQGEHLSSASGYLQPVEACEDGSQLKQAAGPDLHWMRQLVI
jgi:hypothetical protein